MKEALSSIRWLLMKIDKSAYFALFLFILLGFFQGIGLVIIVPLLSITGVKNFGSQLNSSLTRNAEKLFNYLEIPLTFTNVLLLFIVIITILSIIKYKSILTNSRITQEFSNKLRKELHHAIIETEWMSIVKIRSSDMVGLLSREISQISFLITTLIQFVGGIVVLITHIIMAFIISYKVTFWVLFAGAVLVVIQRKFFVRSIKSGNSNKFYLKELQSNLQEHFQNIKLAKSQNLNQQQKDSLEKISEKLYENQVLFSETKAKTDFSYDVGSAIIVSVFLYIVFVVFTEPVLDLVILIYIFSRILPNIKSCSNQIQTILNLVPIVHDIKEKIRYFVLNQEKSGLSDCVEVNPSKSISLNGVTFSYKPNVNVLENIFLEIKVGQITAITGSSGSGKSTLADIITGLLKPISGELLVDGKNLSEIGYKNWRNGIAYMTQERFLFHDSIRNNLLWANPNASEEDILLALNQANVLNYINQLENGLDTIVGDRGIRLSGGQRQRIALAMALIRKPHFLILDEATNELDEFNEKEIYDTIFQLKDKMTIFIITHRLASMKLADKAYCIKDGRVIDWKGGSV